MSFRLPVVAAAAIVLAGAVGSAAAWGLEWDPRDSLAKLPWGAAVVERDRLPNVQTSPDEVSEDNGHAKAASGSTASPGTGTGTEGDDQREGTTIPSEPDATTSEPGSAGGSADPESTPPTLGTHSALVDLETLRVHDQSSIPLDGRWVAQLSSKSDGITDPTQVAANGTNTFHVEDILDEHLRLRSDPELVDALRLLLSTDFGSRSTIDGEPLWVTIYAGDFTTADHVQQWCEELYPDRSGEELANVCLPRSLTAPTSG